MFSIFDPTQENILKTVDVHEEMAGFFQRLYHEQAALKAILVSISTDSAYTIEDYQHYLPKYLEAFAEFFYAIDYVTKTLAGELSDIPELITEVSLLQNTIVFKLKDGVK